MANRCVWLAAVNTGPEDARAEIALKIISAYIERMKVAKKNTVQRNICVSVCKSNKHSPFGVQKGPYFLLFFQRPCHKSRVYVIPYETEVVSTAALMATRTSYTLKTEYR